jgi:TfoX/Sxy family transcriptional regulator of competence genes
MAATPSPIPKPTDADKEWFASLVPEDPEVTQRPMFGNLAAFVNGNMFLSLFGSAVAVRLDESDRAALLAIEGAEPFAPMPSRPMKEYVVMPQWRDDAERAAEWVARALEHTRSLPPKPAKRR